MVVFFRSFFGLLALTPLLLWTGPKSLRTQYLRQHVTRALAGLAAMYCFFYAIGHLPLGEAMLLNYSSPLFIPFIARLWLGEPLPKGFAWAIGTGFVGIALILKPGSGFFAPAARGAVERADRHGDGEHPRAHALRADAADRLLLRGGLFPRRRSGARGGVGVAPRLGLADRGRRAGHLRAGVAHARLLARRRRGSARSRTAPWFSRRSSAGSSGKRSPTGRRSSGRRRFAPPACSRFAHSSPERKKLPRKRSPRLRSSAERIRPALWCGSSETSCRTTSPLQAPRVN